jgi:hypothetical protein
MLTRNGLRKCIRRKEVEVEVDNMVLPQQEQQQQEDVINNSQVDAQKIGIHQQQHSDELAKPQAESATMPDDDEGVSSLGSETTNDDGGGVPPGGVDNNDDNDDELEVLETILSKEPVGSNRPVDLISRRPRVFLDPRKRRRTLLTKQEVAAIKARISNNMNYNMNSRNTTGISRQEYRAKAGPIILKPRMRDGSGSGGEAKGVEEEEVIIVLSDSSNTDDGDDGKEDDGKKKKKNNDEGTQTTSSSCNKLIPRVLLTPMSMEDISEQSQHQKVVLQQQASVVVVPRSTTTSPTCAIFVEPTANSASVMRTRSTSTSGMEEESSGKPLPLQDAEVDSSTGALDEEEEDRGHDEILQEITACSSNNNETCKEYGGNGEVLKEDKGTDDDKETVYAELHDDHVAAIVQTKPPEETDEIEGNISEDCLKNDASQNTTEIDNNSVNNMDLVETAKALSKYTFVEKNVIN